MIISICYKFCCFDLMLPDQMRIIAFNQISTAYSNALSMICNHFQLRVKKDIPLKTKSEMKMDVFHPLLKRFTSNIADADECSVLVWRQGNLPQVVICVNIHIRRATKPKNLHSAQISLYSEQSNFTTTLHQCKKCPFSSAENWHFQ